MQEKIDENLKKLTIIGSVLLLLGILFYLIWIFFVKGYSDFSENEKKMLEAGKKYFEENYRVEIKKNETRVVSLQELFSKNLIDSIYIPSTTSLCDADNSYVKQHKNEEEKIEYYVYLKCGKYKSKTDNTGPKIELNGDKTIYLDLGKKYEELGVKSVRDDRDGNMDIKTVTIDASNLDTSKVGSYKIKYIAKDKLLNITVEERVVYVLEKVNTNTIKNTDETNIYKGNQTNNYIQYSGLLWQIVRVNSDNTTLITTVNNISNLAYKTTDTSFNDSNVSKWLNDYFYKHLINPDKYIKKNSKWCTTKEDDLMNASICKDYTNEYPVGLLSMYDIYTTYIGFDSFLNSGHAYLMSNFTVDNKLILKEGINVAITTDKLSLNPVRPAINLKEDIFIVGGNGSIDNPYLLDDYTHLKSNNYLKESRTGEYVVYSGILFRVISHDKDGNTKLISTEPLSVGNNAFESLRFLYYRDKEQSKIFNPRVDGNIANTLNNEWLNYIEDKNIVNHEYVFKSYKLGDDYNTGNEYKVNAKIAIPDTFELFSASGYRSSKGKYYLINPTMDSDTVYFVNDLNGMVFKFKHDDYEIGSKLVIYLNKDLKIKEGRGLLTNPYILR